MNRRDEILETFDSLSVQDQITVLDFAAFLLHKAHSAPMAPDARLPCVLPHRVVEKKDSQADDA